MADEGDKLLVAFDSEEAAERAMAAIRSVEAIVRSQSRNPSVSLNSGLATPPAAWVQITGTKDSTTGLYKGSFVYKDPDALSTTTMWYTGDDCYAASAEGESLIVGRRYKGTIQGICKNSSSVANGYPVVGLVGGWTELLQVTGSGSGSSPVIYPAEIISFNSSGSLLVGETVQVIEASGQTLNINDIVLGRFQYATAGNVDVYSGRASGSTGAQGIFAQLGAQTGTSPYPWSMNQITWNGSGWQLITPAVYGLPASNLAGSVVISPQSGQIVWAYPTGGGLYEFMPVWDGRSGYFAQLVAVDPGGSGRWSVQEEKSNSSGTGFATGGGSPSPTGYIAIPHTIDGTNYCNPQPGLRVWVFPAKTAGYLEFLPIGYADSTPGLVSITNQVWLGQKTITAVVVPGAATINSSDVIFNAPAFQVIGTNTHFVDSATSPAFFFNGPNSSAGFSLSVGGPGGVQAEMYANQISGSGSNLYVYSSIQSQVAVVSPVFGVPDATVTPYPYRYGSSTYDASGNPVFLGGIFVGAIGANLNLT